jgi:hypothetical protein
MNCPYNKMFWEELICLLSLHKLTVYKTQCHHLHTKFHQIHQSVQKLQPPQKFKVRHFGMAEATGLNDM